MNKVNYEQLLLDDMEKHRQKILEVGDLITGLFTCVPSDDVQRREYYLSLVTTDGTRRPHDWKDHSLYGLWSALDGARRNINSRREQLEAYKDALSRCRLPEVGEFYSFSERASRASRNGYKAHCHIYEVTRGIGQNIELQYGNQGEMRRLTPSGKLSTKAWRFGLSSWANWSVEGLIKEPQYVFEGEYELKHLAGVSVMLPFILGTAETQEEKRKRVCQQNLRKVVKKVIAEGVA